MYEPVYLFSSTDVSNYMYETVRGEFESCCTGLVLTTSCGFMGSLHLFLVCALHIAQLYVLSLQKQYSFSNLCFAICSGSSMLDWLLIGDQKVAGSIPILGSETFFSA